MPYKYRYGDTTRSILPAVAEEESEGMMDAAERGETNKDLPWTFIALKDEKSLPW
jgi:hypothetical protein